MRLNRFPAAGAALFMALALAGHPAESGQRDSQGRDRNGRASQGRQTQGQGQGQRQNQSQSQQRDSNSQQESVTPPPRPQGAPAETVPSPDPGNSAQRRYAVPRPVAPVAPAVRGNGPYNSAPAYGARGYTNQGGYNNQHGGYY